MITGSWLAGRAGRTLARPVHAPVPEVVPRHTDNVRIAIRVRPGAGRTAVGGAHDGALIVRVAQPAVDGRATEAALAAVATALGVRRRQVALVTGTTSRTKVVDVDADDPDRLEVLLQVLLSR
jgi:uncharacterized protein YggU (UPF0235/DUF167 family)